LQDASSKQQTKQKYKPNHQQTGVPPYSALPIRKNKEANKNSAQISPYTKLTQTTEPNLGEQRKPKIISTRTKLIKAQKRVPWTTRRSNQSILKEISPGISLEGMMRKLKLQYFGHLMRRVDSLEKTLMLGGIGGRRRRG